MPLTIVQTCTDYLHFTGSGTYSLTPNFSAPVTPGNAILVVGGMYMSFLVFIDDITAIFDSVGDTFKTICNVASPFLSGPTIFAFLCESSVGGTVAIQLDQLISSESFTDFDWAVMCLELAGSPIEFSQVNHKIFGAEGNDPVALPLDTSRGSIDVTFRGGMGSGGPGTISSMVAIDLITDSIFDNIIAAMFNQNNGGSGAEVPTTTSGYTFSLAEQAAFSGPNTIHVFTSNPVGQSYHFPTLGSGSMRVLSPLTDEALAMYPSQLSRGYVTRVQQFLNDSEQRWIVSKKLFSATLSYHDCSGYDTSIMRNFFETLRGAYVDNLLFNVFDITIDGQYYNYCVFDQDSFVAQTDQGERFSFELKIRQVRPN